MKRIPTQADWQALLDWYQTLTPQTLPDIARFYTENARFKDPFNDVRGVAKIQAVFHHMFKTLEQPRFTVIHALRDGDQAFITWDFDFAYAGRKVSIHGGSHFQFDADGKIMLHRDYWDAAEELFEKIPLLGLPVAWLRKKLKVA
ncbi:MULTISPECIES: nuclear transport factor 2 family protein [Chromobacterium]|uniref:nuclear transport factor 2 family protein n=1 Tax=Chromobacterium TaxID=535 RepID=UPI000D2F7228|nr:MULTISPECIES: nuclear transport factor 2 family protein [Chromobacterium]PTU71100.1 nuclear transport factor 2 family protein [Chromobacterium haemolyticum]QOZ84468.1 nuclear transport factor 2 family protein [Chromobacterium sp. Rain0013]WON84650.1 nuclear transport factor 2 family protein [Chromobacterium haemolyticum]